MPIRSILFSRFLAIKTYLWVLVGLIILVLASFLEARSESEPDDGRDTIKVGAKAFTEGYVLGEILSQVLEDRGYQVERVFGLQDRMAFLSLQTRSVDLYPEYTGTISQVLFREPTERTFAGVQALVERRGFLLFTPFGFNNTYALAVREDFAVEHDLQTISDLSGLSRLRAGFSFGFTEREDGYPGLTEAYGLHIPYLSMEHSMTYQAMLSRSVDVTDIYSTDAKIARYNLKVLEDSLGYFPQYEAAVLAHADINPKIIEALEVLTNQIDEKQMISMNEAVEFGGLSYCQAAQKFLVEQGLVNNPSPCPGRWDFGRLLRQTLQTLYLTSVALGLAILLAVPFGVLLYVFNVRSLSQALVGLTGLLQTIPSLALLFLMIPVFQRTGEVPAIVGLFLYSLLPILRSTLSALESIEPKLREVALALGLSRFQVLRKVEIPLALPLVLSGIRIAAVISVGTATFAAFIGAGGLGEPIVQGVTLANYGLILQGVIPASLLCILIELGMDRLETWSKKGRPH